MIRREIKFEGDEPIWLLISQVEHARISGELAAHWNESFSPEIISGITHHDDGWAEWEAAPQLNPQFGRPYSFLEMPLADAIAIWDRSIAAARAIGPVAGWIVAGHFMALLAGSDHAGEPQAVEWLQKTGSQREAWLMEWGMASPNNSLQTAARAQRLLLVADLLSLWLCCDCPLTGECGSILAESNMKGRAAAVLGLYQFTVAQSSALSATSGQRIDRLDWAVEIQPWPLTVGELAVATPARAAPARHYADAAELAAACWPVELRWQLVQRPSAAVSPT